MYTRLLPVGSRSGELCPLWPRGHEAVLHTSAAHTPPWRGAAAPLGPGHARTAEFGAPQVLEQRSVRSGRCSGPDRPSSRDTSTCVTLDG